MAYFLKKTKNKKGLYLQIYESFYDPERGHTAREKRIVTYNPKLAKKQIYEINKEVEKAHLFTITGHFLICYLSVLLTRLFQFKILKNRYSSEDLFEFIRGFRVAKISETKYINLTKSTTFIKELSASINLPLTSYFLNEGEIKKMLSHRF